jgi:hypothetical protein
MRELLRSVWFVLLVLGGQRRAAKPSRSEEDRVRALLRLAANTVHPSRDGLERIRARTARRRERWLTVREVLILTWATLTARYDPDMTDGAPEAPGTPPRPTATTEERTNRP